MKRNSNSDRGDSNENLWDGSPVGSSSTGDAAQRFDDLESWDREDFEAALPLYVGGELDAQEAARVDAWLMAHPEDQGALAASKQAAGVLARYAEFTKERETPDLWAGIRSELVEHGTLRDAATASTELPSEHVAPILGGPSWFQRKSVAAAAALLLTGSVGLFLATRGAVNGGGELASPSVASATAEVPSASTGDAESNRLASMPGEELLGGELGIPGRPLVSTPVGNSLIGDAPRGKSQKLQLAEQGAERLIDDAPRALPWQIDPWVEIHQGMRRGKSGPQLTGGH